MSEVDTFILSCMYRQLRVFDSCHVMCNFDRCMIVSELKVLSKFLPAIINLKLVYSWLFLFAIMANTWMFIQYKGYFLHCSTCFIYPHNKIPGPQWLHFPEYLEARQLYFWASWLWCAYRSVHFGVNNGWSLIHNSVTHPLYLHLPLMCWWKSRDTDHVVMGASGTFFSTFWHQRDRAYETVKYLEGIDFHIIFVQPYACVDLCVTYLCDANYASIH